MSFPNIGAEAWTLALISALCIGLAKGGFGGLGMIAVLLMAQVLPARESTGAILPMLITADIFAVKAYHQHADRRLVLRLLWPALAGIVCGWLLMPLIPAHVFGRVIGWLTLGLILLVLIQKYGGSMLKFAAEHPGFAWLFGWLAGATTMLANAAGPMMTIYLLACKLPKMEFVGTAAWFFLTVNLVKVPFSTSLGLINMSSLTLNLILAPLVIGGVFAGRWLIRKVNQQVFEWLMILFSLTGAIRLILK